MIAHHDPSFFSPFRYFIWLIFFPFCSTCGIPIKEKEAKLFYCKIYAHTAGTAPHARANKKQKTAQNTRPSWQSLVFLWHPFYVFCPPTLARVDVRGPFRVRPRPLENACLLLEKVHDAVRFFGATAWRPNAVAQRGKNKRAACWSRRRHQAKRLLAMHTHLRAHAGAPRAPRQPACLDSAACARTTTRSEPNEVATTGAGGGTSKSRAIDKRPLEKSRGHVVSPTNPLPVGAAAAGAEAFVGPFLHFARWRPAEALGCLEQSHRAGGGRDLYAHVFGLLEPQGLTVEVGCGLGARCLAMASCCPAATTTLRSVVGVDAAVDRVARATADAATLFERRDPRVRFVHARPERLPFADATVDRILSVEAFDGCTTKSAMAAFVAEAARCLAPGGRLVLCAFLGRHALAEQQRTDVAVRLGPDVSGVEQIADVDQLCRVVRDANLAMVADTLRSVGDQVWEVFCAWCMLAHPSTAWPAAWNRAYASGWIDYFILAADKPR
nr:methyltransferase type .1 [Pandoravirus massiliensis]